MSFIYDPTSISFALKVPIRTVYYVLSKASCGWNFLPKARTRRGSYALSEADLQVSLCLPPPRSCCV